MNCPEELPTTNEATEQPVGIPATAFPRGSTEFDRALSFIDAIFGFSLTLLIAAVDVPTGDAWRSLDTLWATGLGDQLIAFGISFAVVAAFWRLNHSAIADFRALDTVTLRVSIVLVGLVIFIPFTTRAISTSDLPFPIALYALNMILVVLANVALQLLGRARGLTTDPQTPPLAELARPLATAVVFLVSIPIAYRFGAGPAMLSWLSLIVIDRVLDRFAAGRRIAGGHEPTPPCTGG